MKLDYKLHIYMGYYFELSSSNTCISNKKWSYRQVLRKPKIMININREKILQLESLEFIN